MDLKKEFDSIWTDLEKIVMSNVIKNIKGPIFNMREVQNTYNHQLAQWTEGKLREKFWFDSLKTQDEECAMNLFNTAKSFRFRESTTTIPSIAPFYLFSVLLTILLYVLCVNLFDFSVFKKILCIIVCMVISVMILIPIGNTKQENVKKSIEDEYVDSTTKCNTIVQR